jgi:hypothetical protein
MGSHEVHAPVEDPQTLLLEAPFQHAARDSGAEKLGPGHYSMLAFGQLVDDGFDGGSHGCGAVLSSGSVVTGRVVSRFLPLHGGESGFLR